MALSKLFDVKEIVCKFNPKMPPTKIYHLKQDSSMVVGYDEQGYAKCAIIFVPLIGDSDGKDPNNYNGNFYFDQEGASHDTFISIFNKKCPFHMIMVNFTNGYMYFSIKCNKEELNRFNLIAQNSYGIINTDKSEKQLLIDQNDLTDANDTNKFGTFTFEFQFQHAMDLKFSSVSSAIVKNFPIVDVGSMWMDHADSVTRGSGDCTVSHADAAQLVKGKTLAVQAVQECHVCLNQITHRLEVITFIKATIDLRSILQSNDVDFSKINSKDLMKFYRQHSLTTSNKDLGFKIADIKLLKCDSLDEKKEKREDEEEITLPKYDAKIEEKYEKKEAIVVPIEAEDFDAMKRLFLHIKKHLNNRHIKTLDYCCYKDKLMLKFKCINTNEIIHGKIIVFSDLDDSKLYHIVIRHVFSKKLQCLIGSSAGFQKIAEMIYREAILKATK
jgi:hypothetical protein